MFITVLRLKRNLNYAINCLFHFVVGEKQLQKVNNKYIQYTTLRKEVWIVKLKTCSYPFYFLYCKTEVIFYIDSLSQSSYQNLLSFLLCYTKVAFLRNFHKAIRWHIQFSYTVTKASFSGVALSLTFTPTGSTQHKHSRDRHRNSSGHMSNIWGPPLQ